jgi:Fe-S-cluster containining protein
MKKAKPNPCTSCPGHCCSRNLINVCGHDAWVIARELSIKPTDFLAFAQLEGETPYHFQLDGSGKSYYLMLNMNEQPDGSRRCIFGLNLPRRQLRCGIYPLRPIACRAYPFAFDGQEVTIKPWALCPQDMWSLDDLDLPSLREQMGRFQMEFCIYSSVVASWNKQVTQQPRLEKLDFRPFVNFVMDVYDELEEARVEVPSDAWPEIWNRWQKSVASGVNPLEPREIESNPSQTWEQWLQDIHRVLQDAVSKRVAQAGEQGAS